MNETVPGKIGRGLAFYTLFSRNVRSQLVSMKLYLRDSILPLTLNDFTGHYGVLFSVICMELLLGSCVANGNGIFILFSLVCIVHNSCSVFMNLQLQLKSASDS